MFAHATNQMLTQVRDYKLTPEDVKAYKENWLASTRAVNKLSVIGEGAKLKINGKRVK